ncbi:MAG: sulfotransferase [Pseudomonadota bacterium]
MALPDFLIIGGMKCGTSTLAAQLAAQPGVFMTTPKEPNFFSDDEVYAQGLPWYETLFSTADPHELKGEASTHYTKLPTYPLCLERLKATLEQPKFVYMIRNPIERTISHYIHEWTMGVMSEDLNAAFEHHPELIAYSRYAYQIAPYLDAYGSERILLTSLERLKATPEAELSRICTFIGLEQTSSWQVDRAQENASAERIRRFPLYKLMVESSIATALRRTLVPKSLRELIKQRFQMRHRPQLHEALLEKLQAIFAEDYKHLRVMFPEAECLSESYPFVKA